MKITAAQALFSTKLFIAAILAFWFALHMGLTQPYWAMVTCCVCMNPVSGAVRSKAVYRFMGTSGAGVVSLVMAALFGSTPLVLMVVVGLAAATAFGVSFLDRTPRSYGLQLFAITLLLIAVAGVDHPELVFDTVVARVTEISLGIISTTIVDAFIAPGSLGHSLRASLRRWLPNMETWAKDVLTGSNAGGGEAHARLKTLTDLTSMSQLSAALRYDPTVPRSDLRIVLAIQQCLLRIVPRLSSINGCIMGLPPSEREELRPFLEAALAAFEAGSPHLPALADAAHDEPRDADTDSPWRKLVAQALARDIDEVLTIWSEVRRLVEALETGSEMEPALAKQIRTARAFRLTPDVDYAVRMAAGVLVAYAILCGVWYATGWRQGGNAIVLGAVALGFFGGGDEPGKAIAMFGRFLVLAFTFAGVLAYGLMPLANNFVTFVLAMGLIILPVGMWAAVNPMATLLLALGLSNVNLQDHYAPLDFGSFLEACLGSLLGVFVAFLAAALFRSWGAGPEIQRFLGIEAREIARLTRHAGPRMRDTYVNRALGRLSVMAARLAAMGQIDRSDELFGRLRAGINVADVRIASQSLHPVPRLAAERMLEQLRSEADAAEFSPRLLSLIDGTLDALWSQRSGSVGREAMHALAGMRLALFGGAPAWVPKP